MADIQAKLKDYLTLKFLSQGIDIYVGTDQKKVEDILEKKGPGFIFVNINQMNSPWLQMLARLRQYKSEDDYKLVILSDKTDRDFIQCLLLLNVTVLIPEKLENEDIYSRLNKLLNNGDVQNEKRQFQRITPRPNDDITINLSVPNTSIIISAKIINISIGGVALELNDKSEAHWLEVGQTIESAQLRLNSKIGMTGLKIVALKENIAGGRFVRPTDYFFNLIGRYLLERMSSG